MKKNSNKHGDKTESNEDGNVALLKLICTDSFLGFSESRTERTWSSKKSFENRKKIAERFNNARCVKVTIEGLENFTDQAGFMDRTDPFVELALGNETFRTTVKQNAGGTVSFKEEFRFTQNVEEVKQTLMIKVFDSDTVSDELLGTGELDLNQMSNGKHSFHVYHDGYTAGLVVVDIQTEGGGLSTKRATDTAKLLMPPQTANMMGLLHRHLSFPEPFPFWSRAFAWLFKTDETIYFMETWLPPSTPLLKTLTETLQETITLETAHKISLSMALFLKSMVMTRALKWREIKIDSQEVRHGVEMKHPELATALGEEKLQFTLTDWDKLKIFDMSMNRFVRVGDRYFAPQTLEEEPILVLNTLDADAITVADNGCLYILDWSSAVCNTVHPDEEHGSNLHRIETLHKLHKDATAGAAAGNALNRMRSVNFKNRKLNRVNNSAKYAGSGDADTQALSAFMSMGRQVHIRSKALKSFLKLYGKAVCIAPEKLIMHSEVQLASAGISDSIDDHAADIYSLGVLMYQIFTAIEEKDEKLNTDCNTKPRSNTDRWGESDVTVTSTPHRNLDEEKSVSEQAEKAPKETGSVYPKFRTEDDASEKQKNMGLMSVPEVVQITTKVQEREHLFETSELVNNTQILMLDLGLIPHSQRSGELEELECAEMDVSFRHRLCDAACKFSLCGPPAVGDPAHDLHPHMITYVHTSSNGEENSRNWKVRLRISQLVSITLTDVAKRQAQIPAGAEMFAFCYPLPQTMDSQLDEMQQEGLQNLEKGKNVTPANLLLTQGGFVYLDESRQVLAIKAIEWVTDLSNQQRRSGTIRIGHPRKLKAGTDQFTHILHDIHRWHPIPLTADRSLFTQNSGPDWIQYTEYTWLMPNETNSPEDRSIHGSDAGGFLLRTSHQHGPDQKTLFYPVRCDILMWPEDIAIPFEFKDLVGSMLRMNPSKRKTISGVCAELKMSSELVLRTKLEKQIQVRKEQMADIITEICKNQELQKFISDEGYIDSDKSMYPGAPKGQGFSRAISDIFDWAQETVNGNPRASWAQETTNGDPRASRQEQRKQLQAVVTKLICESRMKREGADCVCNQHTSPLTPASLDPKRFPPLVFGGSEEAAKGLLVFIGLNDDMLLGQLLEQGVGAIQTEFEDHGSLQDLENFHYVCYGVAQNQSDMPAHVKDDIEKGTYHGGRLDPYDYDDGHQGWKLQDFLHHEHSVQSNLTKMNVLAARVYTTSSYKRFNAPLRNFKPNHALPHPFKITVYHLNVGLRNLRAVEAVNHRENFSSNHLLYRGMKGREMNENELKQYGGVERAPMSTSLSRTVARSYATYSKDYSGEKGPQIINEYHTEGLSTGTSIDFLSAYPKEKELLYPPLTRIKLQDWIPLTESELEEIYNQPSGGGEITTESDRPFSIFAAAKELRERNPKPPGEKGTITLCKFDVQLS